MTSNNYMQQRDPVYYFENIKNARAKRDELIEEGDKLVRKELLKKIETTDETIKVIYHKPNSEWKSVSEYVVLPLKDGEVFNLSTEYN